MNPALRSIPPLVMLLSLTMTGCISGKPYNPAATRPATAVDPVLAEPSHWLSKPPTEGAVASASSLDLLWEAAEDTARRNHFPVDRRDHRAGLLTTTPVISKQWFELWRDDAQGLQDVQESSLGPIRRTIHFIFTESAGGHTVTPKVLVERQARPEEKYRSGDLDLPATYWYALRRDPELERKLARQIQDRIKDQVKDAPPPAPATAAR